MADPTTPTEGQSVTDYLLALQGAYDAITGKPPQAQDAPTPAPANDSQAQGQGVPKTSWFQNLVSLLSSDKWSPPGWFPYKL